jgi:hypothetical protein
MNSARERHGARAARVRGTSRRALVDVRSQTATLIGSVY